MEFGNEGQVIARTKHAHLAVRCLRRQTLVVDSHLLCRHNIRIMKQTASPHPVWRRSVGEVSLSEVHRSIGVPIAGLWRKTAAFSGPGYLVDVVFNFKLATHLF